MYVKRAQGNLVPLYDNIKKQLELIAELSQSHLQAAPGEIHTF